MSVLPVKLGPVSNKEDEDREKVPCVLASVKRIFESFIVPRILGNN